MQCWKTLEKPVSDMTDSRYLSHASDNWGLLCESSFPDPLSEATGRLFQREQRTTLVVFPRSVTRVHTHLKHGQCVSDYGSLNILLMLEPEILESCYRNDPVRYEVLVNANLRKTNTERCVLFRTIL